MLREVPAFSDGRVTACFETRKGFEGGLLLLGHLDVPVDDAAPRQKFRGEPEWLHGEGIGCSRAPLVMLEFVLRSLRHLRLLSKKKLGVLYYMDEGRECVYSTDIVRAACAKAKRVIVLRPGNVGEKALTRRRGQRKYKLSVESKSLRLGVATKQVDALRWFAAKLLKITALSSRKDRIAVSATEIKSSAFPFHLPHALDVTLLMTYPNEAAAKTLDHATREILGKDGVRWRLEQLSDRPVMKERPSTKRLAKALATVAAEWEIPLKFEGSVWPSAAGFVPPDVPVVCGMAPVATDLYMPQEAVLRSSLVQRTLLLAQFLLKEL